jgi:hypothetical protein
VLALAISSITVFSPHSNNLLNPVHLSIAAVHCAASSVSSVLSGVCYHALRTLLDTLLASRKALAFGMQHTQLLHQH